MKLKNIFLFTGLLLSVITFAQPPGGPEGQPDPKEMVKRQTQEMVDSLGLNKDQASKVEAVNTEFSEKMQELFKSSGGPGGSEEEREAMRTKMDTIRTAKEAELKDILSEEQFAKYQKMEEERRQSGPGSPRE